MFPQNDEQRPPPFQEMIAHHHRHYQHHHINHPDSYAAAAHSTMKKYNVAAASLMDLERTTTASTASSDDDEDDFSVISGDNEAHHDQNQPYQEQQPLPQHQPQLPRHVPRPEQTHISHRLQQQQRQQHWINQQLINATIQGKTEKVRHLLEDNRHQVQVNINATDERYGASPLHYAAMQPPASSDNSSSHDTAAVHLVQLLLQHGANVHQTDQHGLGNTALHHASAKNHIPVALLLLQQGASISVPNKAGQTPVDMAASEDMATTLRNYSNSPPRSVSQNEEPQPTTRLVTPERVEVAPENFGQQQSPEKVQQQRQHQQQQQQRNLSNATPRHPTTFQTKKLQQQHQADMAALQDIVQTLQRSIQQCIQEQKEHQQQRQAASSVNNSPAVIGNNSHTSAVRPRNRTENNDIIHGNATIDNDKTSLQLQSLQDENAALRHAVATLQMENASLHEKLSRRAALKDDPKQSPLQQDPKAGTSRAESDTSRSTIFRGKEAATSRTTAKVFNSSSRTGGMNSVDNRERSLKEQNKGLQEKLVAMQDTLECYKLEMTCLQEQLRASQKQQQHQQTSDHHHRQQHQQAVNPSLQQQQQQNLHQQRVRSSTNKKQSKNDDPMMTISTEQDLQNILHDLLALTRRYMEERDNCQNNNMI